jgi:ankyrin repeat protein
MNYVLAEAARTGSDSKALDLIDQGADVNSTHGLSRTPLHEAAWGDHYDVAALLLKSGADIDARDHWKATPLHYAAWKNSVSVLRLLLSQGADIEAATNHQFTGRGFSFFRHFHHNLFPGSKPIHFAVRQKSNDAARLLILHGADVNVFDSRDASPLGILLDEQDITWSGYSQTKALQEAYKKKITGLK